MIDLDEPARPSRSGWRGITIRAEIASRLMATLGDDDVPGTATQCGKLLGMQDHKYDGAIHWPQLKARVAVIQADALIAELNKPT